MAQNKHLQAHTIPPLFFKIPQLIHLIYFGNRLINLRNWHLRKAIKSLINNHEPGKYIDLGCGEGLHLFPVATRHRNWQFLGYDRNRNTAKFCRDYIQKQNIPNVNVRQLDIDNQKIDEKADIIVCASVLQYLKNDVTGLEHIKNALDEHGTLLLYVPINGKTILGYYRKLKKKADGYDSVQNKQNEYTLDSIANKVEAAGLFISRYQLSNGTAGILANECYYILINWISSNHFVRKLVGALLFALLFPPIILLNTMDFYTTHKTGNGVLIVAKKQTKVAA